MTTNSKIDVGMKIRKGMPTIKSLQEVCERHGLTIYPMGSFYHNTNKIVFCGSYRNEKAALVNEEIGKHFNTNFRPASSETLTTGCIEILSIKDAI
jgi:hypothetical protein